MKTCLGKVSLAATLMCLAPLLAMAQNIASKPGTVDRSIERLTLLPGPYLLSPARNTPTMMPSPIKMEQTGTFRFVPATEWYMWNPKGSLSLKDGSMPSDKATTPPNAKPSLESLRFDSTLRSPVVPLQSQIKSAPARQN